MVTFLLVSLFLASATTMVFTLYNNTLRKQLEISANKYSDLKLETKKFKSNKIIRTIFIAISITFATFLAVVLILGGISFVGVFITLGGTMYVDTRADSSTFATILNIEDSLLKILPIFIFLWLCILFVKFLVNQITLSKTIKHTFESSEQPLLLSPKPSKQDVRLNTQSAHKTALKSTVKKIVIILGIILAVELLITFIAYIFDPL